MNISALFIKRPVMTVLIMISLLIAGILGYKNLPISDLPNIDFPTIQVSANLPGASPDTMSSAVATPLERQFSTIAGIDSMSSVSSLGNTSITIQFSLDRDIDGAAQDVQSAISRAMRQLPSNMPNPPTFIKVNPSLSPILYLAMSSTTEPLYRVDEYAETFLSPQISMISGVAQVNVFGSQKYAVRVQVNPDFLAAYQLSLQDIASAIDNNNVNLPNGFLDGPKQQFLLQVNGQLMNAEEFKPLIVAFRNNGPVRLSDLGTVLNSVTNNKVASWYNNIRAVVLAVQKQPGSNTIAIVDSIKKILPAFEKQLPPGIKLSILFDRTQSIRASVHEVQFTLILAALLVVAVIFIFLRSFAATFIPSIALPLSIIATFAVMYQMGFNIDNLSLLGLTLVVGFVVDDAIVMLENIYRHKELGEGPLEAALKGSREINFTIVSMTLSLVIVFIPVLFMGGLLGRMLYEFGMTIVIAILISGFIALTLTPMLCSRMLTADSTHSRFQFVNHFGDVLFPKLQHHYQKTLSWVIEHQKITLLIFFITLILSAFLFYVIPKGFMPSEDTGQLFAYTEADPSVSFQEMSARQQRIATLFQQDPNIQHVMSSVGAGGVSSTQNAGRIFIKLKPRNERDFSADEIANQLRQKVANIPGMKIYLQNLPTISVGAIAKSMYQYTLQDIDVAELNKWASIYYDEIKKIPGVQDVSTTLQFTGPQAHIQIDRNKASELGISMREIENTLQFAYGAQQVSTIYTSSDDYDVILELVVNAQTFPEMLSRIYIRANTGKLVPLSTISTVVMGTGPLTINHQGQLPSVNISFNLTANASLGNVTQIIEGLRQKLNTPATVLTGFQGSAQAFQSSLKGLGWLLLLAIVSIYIVLGILYESFIHPLTILSGLPAAGAGALLTLLIFNMDLNFYSFMGLIILMGIVKKNAIIMIDFAISAQRDSKPPKDAIYEACLVRFRPIMMTTMAAIMSVIPIAFSWGQGSETRRPLGLAVLGGLLVSQLLTLYITPVIYLYFERVGQSFKNKGIGFQKI